VPLRARRYLSDPWFEEVARISRIQSREATGATDSVCVQYVVEGPGERRLHCQLINSERLLRWSHGSAVHPDLVIRRSIECDRGDLLARLAPQAACNSTALEIPEVGAHLSLLGLMERKQSDLYTKGLSLLFAVRMADSPLGQVCLSFRIFEDGYRYEVDATEEPSVVVESSYKNLLHWFSGPLLLRHLIARDAVIKGNVLALSTVDGMVSYGSQALSDRTREALATYGAFRGGAAWRDFIDDLDSVTEG